MPICRQASTVGTPSRISFQYSSSNTSRRLRLRRVISTPLQIAGVLRQALELARRKGVRIRPSLTCADIYAEQCRGVDAGAEPRHFVDQQSMTECAGSTLS